MKLMFLIVFLALLAMACGSSEPASVSAPAAVSEAAPDAEELRAAAEYLFANVGAALQAGDAAEFLRLLATDIRERCTVEEVQAALASGEVLTPQLEVKAVYMDLEDNNRALVEVAVPPKPDEGSMEGLATAFAGAFPWPIVREDGGWRFNLPFLSLLPGDDCPYAAVAQGAEPPDADVPPPSRIESVAPRLDPPPGVNMLSGGGGRGEGEMFASARLETDMTLAELLEYYRPQVLELGSVVQQEEVTEGLAVLTWTFHDNANRPGFGVLLIAPAGDDQRWVRMWMAGPGLPQQGGFPERRPPPVSAPARP